MVTLSNKTITTKAFTLLEVILTFSILTIISATLFSFFHSGKQVYQRIRNQNLNELDTENFFEVIRKDIMKITNFNEYYLILNSNHLYFFTETDEGQGKISRVDYLIEDTIGSNGVLIKRSETSFPFMEDNLSDFRIILKNIESAEFNVLTNIKIEDNEGEEEEEENAENKVTVTDKIYELPVWKFKFYPLALKARVEKEEDVNFTKPIWLPQYLIKKPAEPILSITKKEFENLMGRSLEE